MEPLFPAKCINVRRKEEIEYVSENSTINYLRETAAPGVFPWTFLSKIGRLTVAIEHVEGSTLSTHDVARNVEFTV